MLAAWKGQTEVVRLLLEWGADRNIRIPVRYFALPQQNVLDFIVNFY